MRSLALIIAAAAVSCGNNRDPQKLSLGAACTSADDCESGLCSSSGWANPTCTQSCTSTANCPTLSGIALACSPDRQCIPGCSEGATQLEGADREICVDAEFVPCSTRDEIADCDACGCEPFGGGECIDGAGCIFLLPDGDVCNMDIQCESGVCYRATSSCGAPRAMGEECNVDAECETGNCSTDGNETQTGVCNQRLGTPCDCGTPLGGCSSTDTCTRCLRGALAGSICSRDACDPVDAPNCPSPGSGITFSCERTMAGGHACFQRCDPTDITDNCYEQLKFCEGGYCQ